MKTKECIVFGARVWRIRLIKALLLQNHQFYMYPEGNELLNELMLWYICSRHTFLARPTCPLSSCLQSRRHRWRKLKIGHVGIPIFSLILASTVPQLYQFLTCPPALCCNCFPVLSLLFITTPYFIHHYLQHMTLSPTSEIKRKDIRQEFTQFSLLLSVISYSNSLDPIMSYLFRNLHYQSSFLFFSPFIAFKFIEISSLLIKFTLNIQRFYYIHKVVFQSPIIPSFLYIQLVPFKPDCFH